MHKVGPSSQISFSFYPLVCGLIVFFLLIISTNANSRILLGVDYLEARNFDVLQGKRVGLLTHPAGVNSQGKSTVVLLHTSKAVNLTSLFGPEHGIYGDEKASVPVDDKIDHRTNLPVFSLYGKFRKPTAKMLANLDCVVIDLQDVGVRCYTYVSCMRYVMEACFEAGVEVIVLDRPNPLGGLKVAGPMIDPEWISYVGAFPMPFVHGMTIAELALWSKQTSGILKIEEQVRKKGKLTLVPMQNWKRSMTWPSTGLKWYPTSPNIPTLDSVAGYPMTGLGAQMGKFKHGIGTQYPFRFLTYEGKSSADVKKALEELRLKGLSYKILDTTDSSGKKISGVYIAIQNWSEWQPTELAFAMMQLSARWQSPSPFKNAKKSEINLFNKHVGSSAWWDHLQGSGGQVNPGPFLKRWNAEVANFRRQVMPYLIY
ncbi:MAG: DUF1343 domain-containing protein [Verrucomicrobia bacterium]|nr:DUF1343 domain-containing protein [Verrucomicrobiota bacterium]